MLVVARKQQKMKRNCKKTALGTIRRRKSKVSPYAIALYAFGLFGVASMVIVYLCLCAQIISSQYQISRLRDTKNTLERSRLALKLEVNRLSSLDRIETIARKELGMTHPSARLVLDMRRPSVLQASLEDVVALGKNKETDSN